MSGSQSQKTQGFCVADFETLSDERRSRSKIFLLFIWIKEPCVRKFEIEGLARSKLLGISQTGSLWDPQSAEIGEKFYRGPEKFGKQNVPGDFGRNSHKGTR